VFETVKKVECLWEQMRGKLDIDGSVCHQNSYGRNEI